MRIGRVLILLGILLGVVTTTYAQQPPLTYGSGATSQVNAAAPLVVFTFTGEVGDLVTVRVLSLSADFSPTLSVNSPIGQQIAFTTTDVTSSGSGSVRADIVLPQSGTYTMQVGSSDGSQGQFAIHLNGVPTQNAPTLQTSVQLDFASGPSPQVVTFAASPSSPLSLQAPGAEVLVHSADGVLVGAATANTSVTVPPGDATYYAVVSSEGTAPVQVAITGGTSATVPDTSQPVPTAAPQVPTTAPPADTAACTITTGATGTNLRAGPGTNYDIIIGLPPNSAYPVTGQNGGWYTIDYNGQTGWLFGGVTTLSGSCSGLTTVPAPAGAAPAPTEAPSTPTLPPQPTQPQPTSQPTQPQPTTQPADTQPAPTMTATHTPTEVTAQTAPPDDAYFVDINIKGGQATHSDAVSYPNGDTEDEVFWNISGFDSVTQSGDLQIIISCDGEGLSNVVFTMANATYSCGDVIDRFVTDDSDSGLIRVTATGGSDIYVTYTILFIGSS